ncbi:MAG: cation diffusion facilitator family transporter [Methyloceanibacter sp.]
MGLAAALTGAFMFVEVAGGIAAGSLALLADAGHMLTDFASLALAWFGFRLSRRPADWKRTYGFDRFQILVAFANGLALFAIAAWIVYEAIERLMTTPEVSGGIMVIIAALGLLVNVVAFALLRGADRDNLNIRGAAIHVLGDLLGSVAALIAAGIILATGWTPADPLLSVLVALLLLRAALRLVKQSGHVLLEGSPEHLNLSGLEDELIASVPGLAGIHHVHAWSLTPQQPMMTLHALVKEGTDSDGVILAIAAHLRRRHGVAHVTVQVERAGCETGCAEPG